MQKAGDAVQTSDWRAWERRVVARTHNPAAERSLRHSRRAVQAAGELLSEGADITTSSVAARAGMSLKTLYAHFEDREEILLALYEEESAAFADEIRAELNAREHVGVDAISEFVRQFFEVPARNLPTARRMIEDHWAINRKYPGEMQRARSPLIDLLHEVLDGAAPGRSTGGPVDRRDAELAFSLLLTQLQAWAIGDGSEPSAEPERITRFVLRAFGHTPSLVA